MASGVLEALWLDPPARSYRLERGQLERQAALRGSRRVPSLDARCFSRANGEMVTGGYLLQLLARYWTEQVGALKAVGSGR
jgi:hypothetical protein